MKEYGKIETLFERDERFVVTDTLRNPVIETINKWIVTEKVDGTNIRVCLTADDQIKIGGRTDKAQLHMGLVGYLQDTFTVEKLRAIRKGDEPVQITLYGEGYGAGIQKGGGCYRQDKGFILFDVRIDDEWWLSDDAVSEIAEKLDIPRAPVLGTWTLEQIVKRVSEGFDSQCSEFPQQAEGIVARPLTPLYDHRKKRLIIKLKTQDYRPEKR